MALTTFYKAGSPTFVYGDISTDFPSTGIEVPNRVAVLIDTVPTGASVTIEFTCDSPADITAGTATFITYKTVAAGNSSFDAFDIAPTGIKLTATATGCKGIIKI